MYTSLVKPFVLSVTLLIGTSACTINQSVRAVRLSEGFGQEIVIVPQAQGVRSSFTEAYSVALQRKGFSVVEKPFGTPLNGYPLASAYIALWSWDLAIYMSYAKIHILEHGKEIGHALYDARMGGGNMNKFIKAEEKINELVDQLFPSGEDESVASTAQASQVAADAN